MKLLVNGCSVTRGDELTSDVLPESIEDKIYREKHVWGGQLAQKLNLSEYNNIAERGSSNKRILRTTIEYIATLSEVERSDLLVIIGWSQISRTEIYFQKKWRQVLPNFLTYFINHEFHAIEDFCQRYMMDDLPCHELFFTYVVSLQSFLKSNNINYFFLSFFPIDWTISTDFDHIINGIDHNTFLYHNSKRNIRKVIHTEAKQRGYDTELLVKPKQHPSELGHSLIAEVLYNELQIRNII
ncbi:MAG: hypothetical protein HC836_16555 [Richelia sp. RM2_1_2]|nr:hypothetical protein [Richelia sp. RM2_1_2]